MSRISLGEIFAAILPWKFRLILRIPWSAGFLNRTPVIRVWLLSKKTKLPIRGISFRVWMGSMTTIRLGKWKFWSTIQGWPAWPAGTCSPQNRAQRANCSSFQLRNARIHPTSELSSGNSTSCISKRPRVVLRQFCILKVKTISKDGPRTPSSSRTCSLWS